MGKPERVLDSMVERIGLKIFYHLKHEVMKKSLLKVTECHCVYYHCMQRKSVGVNNAMVLSTDLTLTEYKLLFLLFSIVNMWSFTTCGICS